MDEDSEDDFEGKRPPVRILVNKDREKAINESLPVEDTKLLEQYKALRSEIRTRIQVANQRGTQGLLVLGGIIATSVSQKNFYVLVFIPLISGLFFANAVISRNETLTIAHHLCNIERRISDKGSYFRYELVHGAGFGSDRPSLFDALTPHSISNPNLSLETLRSYLLSYESWPNYARILLYSISYISFSWILITYWDRPERVYPSNYNSNQSVPSLAVPPSLTSNPSKVIVGKREILVLLLILTVLLLGVGLSHTYYRGKLKNKEE